MAYSKQRRRYRKKPARAGPIARLSRKGNFWGKVASVAKTALEAAGEIKRYVTNTVTFDLTTNHIDDLVGPLYKVNSWNIRPLQEGIAQGTDQTERLGNKIRVKGVNMHGYAKNLDTESHRVRVMVVRLRSNFLLDGAPATTSPLPLNTIDFPRYRDLQVLWDHIFVLSPNGQAGEQKKIDHWFRIDGDCFYSDNTPDKPDKGVIMIAAISTAPVAGKVQLNFNAQVTYHDKA